MKQAGFVGELLGRSDYAIIGEIVEPNTKVLDLGCGEGELLEWLAANKGVEARGVELAGVKVQKAIARGVSVFQCDMDEGLADYPDQAFDYVILSQTLQETRQPRKVLREMLRVGRRAIVAFPNFGHWQVRLSMMFSGGKDTAVLPRDTIYAAVMIICTGVVGICIVVGGLAHHEQTFRAEGAGSGAGPSPRTDGSGRRRPARPSR